MTSDEAFQFTIRSLSRRAQLTEEIRQKLCERGASQEVIEPVLERLTSLGYLADQDVLHQRVKKEIKKGMAPSAIRQKFWKESKELVEEALQLYAREPQESIRELMQTKYKRLNLHDPKQKKRLIAALLRRGFRFEEIINSSC